MNTRRWISLGLTTTLAPTLALAHPGHGAGAGFMAGALHPLGGLDHLATMIAIGLWAAQLGSRLRWAVPASFMLLMLVGACVGLYGPAVGAGGHFIAASLLLLGVLMATAARLPITDCLLLAGGFAFFHGYAHGAEAPSQSAAVSYLVGMLLTTACLHLVGLGLGRWLEERGATTLTRWIGAAAAVLGVALLVG
jgi:urease accessory protein